ncbi:MAG: acyltransferase [Lachnospiraceae bacterium]|nr:acyltransferase [Lachnospiraceae bacterium]
MRKHYIDNLRWIIILLLIPYHAAMAWNVWGEPNYMYFEGNRIISSVIVFLSPYFMPVLFVLAGISTRFALQKRTDRQYIWERTRKLLIPFIFGTLVFMPVMTYIAEKFNYNYDGNLFLHYSIFFTRFTDLTGSDGGFSVGHFWFVLYLFVISLVSVGIIALQKKVIPEWNTDVPLWSICVLGLPLTLLSELFSIGGKSLAEYTYLFLVGYYFFSNDNVISETEKHKWLFLCVGLTATVLNVYMFIWSDTQHPLLNTIAKLLSEWFMLIAIIGLGKRYLEFDGKISAWMSQRSFTFYIFHFIWVVLFQYLMYGIYGNNTILLYIVPVLAAYCATLLCCEICIRIPLLGVLTGTKRGQSVPSKGNVQGR